MTYASMTYRMPPARPRAVLRIAAGLVAATTSLLATPSAEAQKIPANPNDFISLDEVTLFVVDTPERRRELWRTDGTPGGTHLLPGCDGGPCAVQRFISGGVGRAVGGALFVVDVGELWFTDGTATGTVRLVEDMGFVPAAIWWPARQTLMFDELRTAEDGNELSLWSSDRTPEGTSRITQLPNFFESPQIGDGLLWWVPMPFGADEADLWRTDGTAAGTFVAESLGAGTDGELFTESPPLLLGPRIVLGLVDGECRQQVWSTDGTDGGSSLLLLGPARPRNPSLSPGCDGTYYVSDGERVFFEFEDEDGDRQLWVTDGAAEGTRRVTQLADVHLPWLDPGRSPVVFVADDGEHGRELWTTDGSPGGTRLLADLCPGSCSSTPNVIGLRPGGPFFIEATDSEGRSRPWWSDGTPEGTRQLADVCPGSCSPDGARSFAALPTLVGHRLYFIATDPLHGEELWTSAGGAPARRLTDFPDSQALAPFRRGEAPGERLLFVADDGVHGRETWITDGTSSGTHLLVDVSPWDNAIPPPPARPGAPSITRVRDNGLNFVFLDWQISGSPADRFVVESRSPGHEWQVEVTTERKDTILAPEPGVPMTYRVKAVDDRAGDSPYSEAVSHTLPLAADGTACAPDPRTLCLDDGRFQVRAAWRNQHSAADGKAEHGQAGAMAIPGSDRAGHFWFFRPDNVELVVKVLDGTAINGFHWTFYGALTDVEYWITVTDTTDGTSRTYHNPPGRVCGRGDTESIAAEGATPATAAAWAADTALSLIPPASRGLSFDAAPRTVHAASHPAEVCVPGADTLCLLDGRFRVRVAWEDQHNGGSGTGSAMPYSDRTGFFTFFHPANVELAVKALDGRAINGKIWFFYGALSDVGYTITVEDLDDGHAVQRYVNPPGNLCGRADTAAF